MRKRLFYAAAAAIFTAGCQSAPGMFSSAPPKVAENQDTYICNGLPIRKMLLDENDYNREYKLPGPMTPRYVTIHNTANKAPAVRERDYLNNRRDSVYISFHFAVDESEAVQIMPMDMHGWHAGDGHGDGNMKSIGIEICRSILYDGDLYRRSEDNAVKLAAWLLFVNHLTIDDLRMHQDWSGKKCPHRIIEDNRWPEFRQRVADSLAELEKNK